VDEELEEEEGRTHKQQKKSQKQDNTKAGGLLTEVDDRSTETSCSWKRSVCERRRREEDKRIH